MDIASKMIDGRGDVGCEREEPSAILRKYVAARVVKRLMPLSGRSPGYAPESYTQNQIEGGLGVLFRQRSLLSTVSLASLLCVAAWGQTPAPGTPQTPPAQPAPGQAAPAPGQAPPAPGQAPAPAEGQPAGTPPAPGAPGAAAPAGQPQKNWKDRAEYDLFESITKEADPQKKIGLLDQWKQKYAQTEYNKERELLYLDAHKNANQAPQMYEAANRVLAIDPKDPTALYYITILVPSLQNAATNQEILANGEKAARMLADNIESMRQPGTTDEQWKAGRPALETQAYRTLGWIGMVKKDNAAAEQSFVKSLEITPTQGEVSYWLGNTIIGLKDINRYPAGLYHIARAVAYDGPGALPPAGKTQIDAFLTKAYTGYHGSPEGLDQVKAQAKTTALPPPDFTIASIKVVEAKKQEEEKKRLEGNPELAVWLNLKANLTAAEGAQFFETMKGQLLPKLSGSVVSADPKTIQIAPEGTTPEIALEIEEGSFPKVEPGIRLTFTGVAKTFTKEPFLLTLGVERSQVTGLPAAAKAKKPAAGKAKRRR